MHMPTAIERCSSTRQGLPYRAHPLRRNAALDDLLVEALSNVGELISMLARPLVNRGGGWPLARCEREFVDDFVSLSITDGASLAEG